MPLRIKRFKLIFILLDPRYFRLYRIIDEAVFDAPSSTKGISRQPKAVFGLENQWRLENWFNFKCIIIIIAFFLWNPSHWGSVLNYDYVLKLIMIIMKSHAWLLWWIVTEISSVLGWIRWRLRLGYPKNWGNSTGFSARSLDTFYG